MRAPARHPALSLALLAGSLLAISVCMFVVPLAAPTMVVPGLSSAGILALTGSAQWIGAIASTMATPGLVIRFGAARVCASGPACTALALACFAWPSPFTLVLGGLLIGVAIGQEIPASAEFLSRELEPGRLGRALSLKQAAMPLGAIVAGAALPPMVAEHGLRSTALWCALLAAALATLMLVLLPSPRPSAASPPGRAGYVIAGVARALLHPPLRATLLVGALSALSLVVLNTFLVLLLVQVHAQPVRTAGLVLAAAQWGALLGRLSAAGLATGPRGERVIFGSSGACTLLGLALLEWSSGAVLMTTAAVMLGLGVSSNSAILVLMAQRRAPSLNSGVGVSAAMFCNFLTCSAAPSLFVLAQGLIGMAASFAALVSLGALASLSAAFMHQGRSSIER